MPDGDLAARRLRDRRPRPRRRRLGQGGPRDVRRADRALQRRAERDRAPRPRRRTRAGGRDRLAHRRRRGSRPPGRRARSGSRTSRTSPACRRRSDPSRTRTTSRTDDGIQTARLRNAGAVFVGKTASPEFGAEASTRTLLFGTTRNPWNLERTPGGSSGGSAAAVAAAVLPIASGSDGGGSIRIPASYSGLFGAKGTYGRIPKGGVEASYTTSFGCMARSVRDTARYWDCVVGSDERDAHSLPHPGLLVRSDPRRRAGRSARRRGRTTSGTTTRRRRSSASRAPPRSVVADAASASLSSIVRVELLGHVGRLGPAQHAGLRALGRPVLARPRRGLHTGDPRGDAQPRPLRRRADREGDRPPPAEQRAARRRVRGRRPDHHADDRDDRVPGRGADADRRSTGSRSSRCA